MGISARVISATQTRSKEQRKRAHSFTALRRIEQKTVIMSDGEVRV